MINEGAFKLKKNGEPYCNCFCRHPEMIENYDKAMADATQTWECHHRLETHNSDGERRLVDLTIKELVALDMYYDRPAEEMIFLTKDDHVYLHKKNTTFSEEHKRKISEARKGKPTWSKGKKKSEETKRKLSESMKNRKDLSRKVMCIETSEVFESTREAERKTGIIHNNISAVCLGKCKTAGGYHWRFV